MRRLDTEAACLLSLHEQASSFWRDLRSDLSHYLDRIDLDPAHLAQLEERCSLVQSLKRKYGATIDEIVRFGENAAAKLQTLERRDAEVQRLAAELERVNRALDGLGRQLTSQRRAIAPKLTRAAMAELGNLGFRQCRFEIDVRSLAAVPREKGAICPTGLDTIEFLFAPNPGEPARPLRAMASSGEMARVMLALKTVLAAHDGIPVLVFDEVDANIGGETAHAVGRKMRQIGHHHQVLCVSHLAPVAACAEHHFAVTKEIRDGRTFTEIRPVTRAERIEELARMLGGAGDAARRHAEALLAAA
jgi:DNA repair protein RecN (Recombination protein N)